MKRLREWWNTRHELWDPKGMREGDVGARLYGYYTDRRRGITTMTGSYIAAQSIMAPKITAWEIQ